MSLLSEHRGFAAVFPGGNVGLFGARGFTRLPAVLAILDPYERPGPGDDRDDADLVPFGDLPRAEAVRLLALLPANQGEVAAQGAPSFARLLTLTRRCLSARFGGFRVSPRRLDERVVVDRLTLSGADVTPARRRRLASLAPTELRCDGGMLVARW